MKRRATLLVPLVLALAACSGEEPGSREAAQSREIPTRTARSPSADGVEIEYTVHGDGPLGLILIHGWLCDREFWHEQIGAFAPTHTVVTIDLAGHGASGTDRDEWTVDRFASDVLAVAETLDNEQLILVGHSLGGQIALAAAPALSDRLLGVVGVDTLHDAGMVIDPVRWQTMVDTYAADFPGTCARFVQAMFSEPPTDPALPGWIGDRMCSTDSRAAIETFRHMPEIDLALLLENAGTPVRCINSTRSMPTAVETNRRHADFDVRLVEDAGHFLMLERPEEFNRLLAETIEELTGS